MHLRNNIAGLMKLYLKCKSSSTWGLSSKYIGKILLNHYNKYKGETEPSLGFDTPIQTVYDTEKVVAGYSTIDIIKKKLADTFRIEEEKFVFRKIV